MVDWRDSSERHCSYGRLDNTVIPTCPTFCHLRTTSHSHSLPFRSTRKLITRHLVEPAQDRAEWTI